MAWMLLSMSVFGAERQNWISPILASFRHWRWQLTGIPSHKRTLQKAPTWIRVGPPAALDLFCFGFCFDSAHLGTSEHSALFERARGPQPAPCRRWLPPASMRPEVLLLITRVACCATCPGKTSAAGLLLHQPDVVEINICRRLRVGYLHDGCS